MTRAKGQGEPQANESNDEQSGAQEDVINRIIGFYFPVAALFGIAISQGIFIITVVKDKEDKLRYLLHVAGERPVPYYLGLFLGDLALYVVPLIALILLSVIMDIKGFYENAGVMFIVLFLLGIPLIN